MKKKIVLLILVLFTSLCLSANAKQMPHVTVTLDGEPVNCASYGQQAIIVEGRTLVPLRAIFEALGASVEWDAEKYVVTSTLDETTISLKVGEKTLFKNGKKIALDVPAMLMNDRTMIPVRAVSEAFGIKVDWIDATRTVVLLTDGYTRGVRSDKVYYGEWLGFNYTLPDGFVFTDEARLFEQMDVISIAENDVDFSRLPCVYEFEVTDGKGNVLSVACEKVDGGRTAKEYLKEAMKVYELSGIKAEISNEYEITVAENTALAVNASAEYLGVGFTQSLAVFEKNGRIVSFVFSYNDDVDFQKLLSGFGEYKKPSQKPVINESLSKEENNSSKDNKYVYSEKHHAYGEFYLGMTRSEAKKVTEGEIFEKNGGEIINVFDEKGVYNDEDKRITSDINCDLISLTFDEGILGHVYVSTEFVTLERAKSVLESIKKYYGEPEYVYQTEEEFYDTYFWSDANTCADCTIIYRENYGYSCILEIYTAE